MRKILFALPMMLLWSPASAQPTAQEIALKVAQDYLIPKYEQLARAASAQAGLWGKTCDYDKLRPAYHATADAWGEIQHINFGPITLLLRRDRLYHWPERRNAVAKSMRKLYAREDVGAVDRDAISKTSVALQGLPALERVMFSDYADQKVSCQVGKAIAENIAEITTGTHEDWLETVKYVERGDSHPIYFETMQEIEIRLFTELLTGFEIIYNQKLALPLGSSLDKAKGKRAEAWRSGRSTIYVQKTTRGLYDMSQAFMAFLPPEAAQKVDDAYKALIEQADGLPASLKDGVANETDRAKIVAFREAVSDTRTLVAETFTKHLDLSVGFNSLDGD